MCHFVSIFEIIQQKSHQQGIVSTLKFWLLVQGLCHRCNGYFKVTLCRGSLCTKSHYKRGSVRAEMSNGWLRLVPLATSCCPHVVLTV